jgi:hypothetical protein
MHITLKATLGTQCDRTGLSDLTDHETEATVTHYTRACHWRRIEELLIALKETMALWLR